MTVTCTVSHPLFGVAYYDEYIPKDLSRIDTDMSMMKKVGINVVRIAESTWSTCEPQPGIFDFSHIDRMLNAAQKAGIQVIVGTPTYAVPSWLVSLHPDILAVTPQGVGKYGARQNMDIVNGAYLFYAERIIRKLISHVAGHPAVIGYQVDNETKYYDSVSPDMQQLFVEYLRNLFHDDLDSLNSTFGLDYWSNRINGWEQFPDITASINESLRAEFDKFRRTKVAEFLAWQANIVREYATEQQFVTQNFDFEWRGYSYGVQPAVNHFEASKAVDIVGVDIYHPTEDELTGKEIAFGGDMARSLKKGANYLVLETQAQGQHGWLPYPGQLSLQAYSHFASGADGVMYWHWHSIHNSYETYWKGLLSHDFETNPTYEEAGVFGREIASPEIYSRIRHLHKMNQVAIMVSNESLSALDWFRIESGFPDGVGLSYNDVVRSMYDALFELNVECDFVPADIALEELRSYKLVITPALYCASQATIDNLREYVNKGGHLLSTVRSFVADEHVTVWHDSAPHGLTDVFGMSYNQFTKPHNVGIALKQATQHTSEFPVNTPQASALIELLKVQPSTQVLASYQHYVWNGYAAITTHDFGEGSAQYLGTILDGDTMRYVLRAAVEDAKIESAGLRVSGQISVRQGSNDAGETVTYLLNYSGKPVFFSSPVNGKVLIEPKVFALDGTVDVKATGKALADSGLNAGSKVRLDEPVSLGPWSVAVLID